VIEAVQELAAFVSDLEPKIFQAVGEEPNVSCRRLALRMGVSNFTIRRTLHEQGLHPYPYHLQRVQYLKPEDPSRQMHFVNGFFKKSTKNSIFKRRLNHR
jgi:hypothetical protein